MKQHFLFKHLSAQKLHYYSFLLLSILGGLLLTRNYAAGYICTRSGSYFFTFLGYLLCLFLFSHALKVGNAGHSSYSRCRCIFYFSVLPFLAFFMEELLWNESFFAISGKSLLINYLVEYLFLLSLFLLIRSFHPTFVLFLCLNWIYGMANHYVLEFKGCPPLFSDLLASQTAITVMGNYSYALDDAVVIGTFLFLYTSSIFPFLKRMWLQRMCRKKITHPFLPSISCLYGFWVFCVLFSGSPACFSWISHIFPALLSTVGLLYKALPRMALPSLC